MTSAGPLSALCLLLVNMGPAAATDDTTITIELNRLEDVQSGCRLSYVLTNGLAVPVDALTIEAVLFDLRGRVDRFLLLKARPLPVGKTRVQQFDVRQTSCAGIGRILLNDVTECAGEDLSPAGCLASIRTSSKAEAPFVSTITPESSATPDGEPEGRTPSGAE